MMNFIFPERESQNQKIKSILNQREDRTPQKKWLRDKFSPILRLDKNDELYSSIENEDWFNDVVFIENQRYLYKRTPEALYIKDISWPVQRQIRLIYISFFALFLSGILSYLLSKLLLKKWLRDLHTLHQQVAQQKISNLHVVWDFDHLPEDDEIAMLAHTFRKNNLTLDQQIQDMKKFVAHASHELRTPLMSLRARQDLAAKNHEYESLIQDNISSIEKLQDIIDGLMLLSLSEKVLPQDFDDVSIQVCCNEHIKTYNDIYAHKDIVFTTTYHSDLHVSWSHAVISTIFKNLIENACKYVDDWGSIRVSIKNKNVYISNTWSYLTPDQQKQIWKIFWQSNEARSVHSWYGLWLSIVDRLCSLYDYTKSVESDQKKGTTFIIWF